MSSLAYRVHEHVTVRWRNWSLILITRGKDLESNACAAIYREHRNDRGSVKSRLNVNETLDSILHNFRDLPGPSRLPRNPLKLRSHSKCNRVDCDIASEIGKRCDKRHSFYMICAASCLLTSYVQLRYKLRQNSSPTFLIAFSSRSGEAISH